VPASELPRIELEGDGNSLVDLLADTGLAKSKGEARRLIASGGVYVNNVRAGDDPAQAVRLGQAVDGRFVVLRVGKKQYHLVKVLD
jgi:tyrosyl-tRNA synthetase